eukprot:gene1804-946_t
MDLLSGYGSESSDQEVETNKLVPRVNITPDVLIKETSVGAIEPYIGEITHNPTYEELHAPVLGPVNPYSKNMGGNLSVGNVQNFNMNISVFNSEFENTSRGATSGEKKNQKLKRKKGFNDPTKKNFLGPWTNFEMDTTDHSEMFHEEFYEDEEEEKEKEEKEEPKKKKEKKEQEDEDHSEEEGEKEKEGEFVEPPSKSNFYLESQYDYQGRTFIAHPTHLKINEDDEPVKNFLPKKLMHTFDAHSKPITGLEFFPKYGHLVLSCSMDETIKIFDVMDRKTLIRDYIGHTQPVSCIGFQSDGKVFASGSHDKLCRLWDVESGNIIKSFNLKKPAHCVSFHPEKNHEILIGVGKRVEHYDVRSGDLIQSYGGHQGPVTSITFFDNNQKFISSSNDKTIRIWEVQVPMVVRKIRNYHMDQIKSVAVHPGGEYFIAQSLDNQIYVFDTTEKYKLHSKKNLTGHITPTTGSKVNFSNDGRFVLSGDTEGKLWIWDWKTSKKLKTLNAHVGGFCSTCQWHPIESSKCITGGWDGKICLFD